MLILLNKPFRVLSQFQTDDDRAVLKDYIEVEHVYPAGRLDYDSEGLLALTDNGALQARISQPKSKIMKTYWAQVEGECCSEHLQQLMNGVSLKDGNASAIAASSIEAPPGLWPRNPPIRYRASIPDCWLEITIAEGRNRQVRRMTAAVGLPTLRLIRSTIGPWSLETLAPGEYRTHSDAEAWDALRRI